MYVIKYNYLRGEVFFVCVYLTRSVVSATEGD